MAIIIGKRTNLDAPIKVESLNGVTFTSESEAHQFVVRCEQRGQELNLAGTISAKFIRADGNTIQLVGSIVDGAAVVTLAQDCYNVQGRFQLAIFNTVGNTKLCIYACVGTVQKAQSGNLIDGGSIILDVEDLIADIQEARQSIPPTYDTLLASIAGTYDSTKTYAVGDYAWYDGQLKKCIVPITTAEAWTAAHWSNAVIGDDVNGLKSAIDEADLFTRTNQLIDLNNPGFWLLNKNYDLTYSRAVVISDLIPITLDTDYYFAKDPSISQYCCKVFLYDQDGNYISGSDIFGYLNNSSVVNVSSSSFPNAKYLRFRYVMNQIITSGDVTWEQFRESLVWVNLTSGVRVTDKYVPYENASIKILNEKVSALEDTVATFPIDKIADILDFNGIVVNSFDGELLNGYYDSTTGLYISGNQDKCTKNKISCKAGERVLVQSKKSTAIRILFYNDEDSVILTNRVTSVYSYVMVAPSNTSYANVNFSPAIVEDDIIIYVTDGTIEEKLSALTKESNIKFDNIGEKTGLSWYDNITISNGTVPNPSNVTNVNTDFIPVPYVCTATINVLKPLTADGIYYNFGYALYDSNKTAIGSYKDTSHDDPNHNKVVVIDNPNVAYIRYTIAEAKASGYVTLRTTDFIGEKVLINFEKISVEVETETEELNHKLDNARHNKNFIGTPLTIVHFSDIHADTSALGRIIAKAEKLEDIDEYICTGDMCANSYGQISSWWNKKVLTCIGNHDTASYSNGEYDWTALSMADRDAYYIAPFEDEWDVTHTSGTSYYYKDYSAQKVRLIVMDGMLYMGENTETEAQSQTTWLEGLLADAITNNLHVLIAIHAPHGGSTAKVCSFSRYNQGTMPTYTDCNTPQDIIDAVSTSITGGLKFIGYICGHQHQDNIFDAENDGKQLMYTITCANCANSNAWKSSDQHRSSAEDAYNIITIDTTNTLVKIIRGGGANIDNHMRAREAICFDYSTGEKVGEIL